MKILQLHFNALSVKTVVDYLIDAVHFGSTTNKLAWRMS
jgi:hypothetical protein